ncbi:hypothetical protein DMH25_01960 [Streptomyces sp. WAC 01325]|nr:hypothetical protein DMH25_01960 [Streptomyces sp. WAC 01325]
MRSRRGACCCSSSGTSWEDQCDGSGLGVQGTPTFFFDGTRIQNPSTCKECKALIEDRGGTAVGRWIVSRRAIGPIRVMRHLMR